MTDVNAFLKRSLLAAAISVLPLANIAAAHGGGSGGSSGSGSSSGSSSSGSSSSSSGHSGSGSSSGHSASATSVGHGVGHSPSKVSRSADPSMQVNAMRAIPATGDAKSPKVVRRPFEENNSSTGGYTQQNTETNQDEWRRRHKHLLFGFIRY